MTQTGNNGDTNKSGARSRYIGRAARMTVLLTVWAFGLLLLFSPNAQAQNVRASSSGFGIARRQANMAAEKAGRTDWPALDDGTSGTQVHVSFNARNADITLVTQTNYAQSTLLARAQTVARESGFPRADFITHHNLKTSVVDIELNKYLRPLSSGKRGAAIELALSRLAQELAKTDLPRPIVFYLSGDAADAALLQSAEAEARPIGDATFLSVDEVLKMPQAQTVLFRAEVSSLSSVVAGGFVLLFAFLFFTMARMPWNIAKARRKKAEKAAEEPATPDPAEVQRKYNAQKPAWVMMLFVFAPFLCVPFLVIGLRGRGSSRAFEDGFALLSSLLPGSPLSLPTLLMIGTVAVGGVSWGICHLVERHREKRQGTPSLPTAANTGEINFPRIIGPFLAIAASLFGPIIVIFLPESLRQALGPVGLKVLLAGSPLLGFSVAAFLCFRNWKKNRTDLLEGDPWHNLVMEVAQKAGGVQVRHVVLTQSNEPNASASLFKTVALTRGLVTKMEPNEVRVVVAHEIAHLKSGHATKTFAVSLLVFAAYLALFWFALLPQKAHLSPAVWAMLSSPMPGILLGNLLVPLVTGYGRRQREHEADRLAAQIVGDPEAVIHTLRKLHTLSATPHHLKPSDELLSSHPSLAHRIDALRQMQPGP